MKDAMCMRGEEGGKAYAHSHEEGERQKKQKNGRLHAGTTKEKKFVIDVDE